jgi:hypothetical protein
MTEAELWGLAISFSERTGGFGAQLLTIVSAYLAVAYFIGSRLTRGQALVVSVIFAGAALRLHLNRTHVAHRAAWFAAPHSSSVNVRGTRTRSRSRPPLWRV